MIRPSIHRPSAVLRRDLRRRPTVAVAGEGAYILDEAGKRYLDAIGGAAVREQVGRLECIRTSIFTNAPSEALAQALMDRAPAGSGHGRAAFLGSRSEATEAALKLARQYLVERGDPARGRTR